MAALATPRTKQNVRPLADLRFSPDPPSMPSDDALHNGESYPSTFKFIGAVEPLKGPKKLVCILCMKSGPVVANVDYDLVIDGHLADLPSRPNDSDRTAGLLGSCLAATILVYKFNGDERQTSVKVKAVFPALTIRLLTGRY